MQCRRPESNRHGRLVPQDFKSCASACSATAACHTGKWMEMDSNHRSASQQIYSLPPLATREPIHISLRNIAMISQPRSKIKPLLRIKNQWLPLPFPLPSEDELPAKSRCRPPWSEIPFRLSPCRPKVLHYILPCWSSSPGQFCPHP